MSQVGLVNTKNNEQSAVLHEEQILVVPRTLLFGEDEIPSGFLSVDMSAYELRVQKHCIYMPRAHAEVDAAYKQIIPYFIFTHNGRYFLMRRGGASREGRLHHKYTFGIGGHIRQEDTIEQNAILSWGMREFHEEVIYQDTFTIRPLGVVNDESNSVGQVHTGFVYLVEGSSPDISIRSELVWGELLTLDECLAHYDSLETWSRMIYDSMRAL